MRKYIIPFKDFVFRVQTSKDNTCILDSYKLKKKSDMKEVLELIREKAFKSAAVNNRSIKGMVNEWRVHNFLYSLGIAKTRTKDVDLELNQPWYMKFLYSVFSFFIF